MIQLAQWDTENFGIRIGNLIPEGEISKEWLFDQKESAFNLGYDLLYLKDVTVPSDILNSSFFLADEKVIYEKLIGDDEEDYAVDPNVVSLLYHEYNAQLEEIAFESGRFSRYNYDKRLPSHVFKTLYSLWMKRSLAGFIADDVLGYMIDGNIAGIITYSKTGIKFSIGLMAVLPQFAGKGVGTKLMQTLFAKCGPGSVVEVATQRLNNVACCFYEKNGYVEKGTVNIYHYWIR